MIGSSIKRARSVFLLRALSSTLAVVGLLALGYWAVIYVRAHEYQAQETQRLANERHIVPHTAPQSKPRPYPATGSVVAMMTIPRLGLSTIVVEGAEERELKLGPGHIPATALPGEAGNVGVAGHRDTFFRPLRLIRKDDLIGVITHEKEYLYKVVSTEIVAPEDIRVLYPTGRETLTLVTCYPFDFIGSAPKRFIVRADCADCEGTAR